LIKFIAYSFLKVIFIYKKEGHVMDKNGTETFNSILEYISPELSKKLWKIPDYIKKNAEEIRLRKEKPLMIFGGGTEYFLMNEGSVSKKEKGALITTHEDLVRTFQLISRYSVYAFEEEMRSGFITLKGGHRVGIAGKTVYGAKGIESIRDISSLNMRIGREKKGISDNIMKFIIILIVSPPQCGKTTLLRDMIRNISNGMEEYDFRGLKVGLVDERSEIGGVYNGVAQNDLGIRTDILDGCLKSDGITILIRAMSPQVVATDELGDYKDINAVHEALRAGVRLISTVHGKDIEDLLSKKSLSWIIEEKIFERIIFLDNSKGVGTVRDIVEGYSFNSVLNREKY
jgi:stage III sporulation protein AA